MNSSPDIGKSRFAAALALEAGFPASARRAIGRILTISLVVLLLPFLFEILSALFFFIPREVAPYLQQTKYITDALSSAISSILGDTWQGLLMLALGFRAILGMLNCFANAATSDTRGNPLAQNIAGRFNLYAAEVWYRASIGRHANSATAIMEALPQSVIGSAVLERLSIPHSEQASAMKNLVAQASASSPSGDIIQALEKTTGSEITLSDIMSALFESTTAFRDFFMQRGYTAEMVRGGTAWMEREHRDADLYRRWWSRERLGRIPGLAKNLAYGQTPFLRIFARDIGEENTASREELIGQEQLIRLIESALLKQSGANIMIVGEPGSSKDTLLVGLADLIRTGRIFPELEHKRVFRLHTAALVAAGKTKGETQAIFLRLLNETARAGNIILAIDDFPEFMQSLSALGVSAVELLSPYLESPAIHIIGLANTLSFRRILETEGGIMEHFMKIDVPEPDDAALQEILERLAPDMEKEYRRRAIFTYPALEKIREGATQNLVEGAMPQRAINLVQEVLEAAIASHSRLILPELVLEIISRKTHLPLGAVGREEQDKLLRLEEFLRARVVGQDEAISAVADAIRRQRSGIRNPKRPIGTFLFMGPTGVGKTETAKTIAATYFGNEDAMLRFDMSEYHAANSVERLIGSFERNEPGILASKMRSNPYSVVLLDEFEKAHLEVRNLFLQILDEGFFSDYLGTRVNMRNTIIVATSNAGSALIARLVGENPNRADLTPQVLAAVQNEGIMSPELLNRFDSVVIFRPLDEENLRKIARLMLIALASRLKKQNIVLSVTNELAAAVAKGGYNPAFGARPMQRFIQDHIEKVIAEKILRQEIKPGVPFSFSAEDLTQI